LKRGQGLIIKTFPVLMALLPRPHSPSFVSDFIFLPWHHLQVRCHMKQGKSKKCIRDSWLLLVLIRWINDLTQRLMAGWYNTVQWTSCWQKGKVTCWLKAQLDGLGNSSVNRSGSLKQEDECKQDALVFIVTLWLCSETCCG
jgi:hypothetical protein